MTAGNLAGQKVVVTGGAGFIGSSLVEQLAAIGARVTVVDNLVNGKRENVAASLGPDVTLEVADIRDGDRMASLIRGADTVYHLACLGVRHSIHSPIENHAVNADATLHLLEAARHGSVGRFVHVSTSEVYGTARHAPMTEAHPTEPHTVYGAAKLAGERYAAAYWTTYRLPTVVVRPFNAFGPRCHHEGDSGEVIPKFMLRAMTGRPLIVFGDGTQTRDFTYVADTAAGIMEAGVVDAAVGHTINLGSGREITVRDLADVVAGVVGRNEAAVEFHPSRPGDVLRLFADAGLAKQLLAFEPGVSLRDGLSRLHAWYLESGTEPEQLLQNEVVAAWQKPA